MLSSADARRVRDRPVARRRRAARLRDYAGCRAPDRRDDRPPSGHAVPRAGPAARSPADRARPRGGARRSGAPDQPGQRGAPVVPRRPRVRIAGPIYRLLLRAYPRAFRERFGAGMHQAFRDRHQAAAARGAAAVAGLLVRTLVDVAANAFALRVIQRERPPMNWQSLLMDARYACRMFVRNPVFTMLAVAALTLGIGANTAIFTIVNGILLRPLPYAEPGRLVMVWSTNAIEHRDHDVVAPLDFVDFRKAGAFSELHAAY